MAPSNVHLKIDKNKLFRLSSDPAVQYSIPSIDVLFESAASTYKNKLIGIILTGSNADGSDRLKAIRNAGGLTIIEDPNSAVSNAMPNFALASVQADHILPATQIADLLTNRITDIIK